ncbi:Na-translocating system protein MpsC family protein [Marinicrinis lubricantis]|uniref:Na-translocating system protein MpsC family protein n=1 Tax=Marinicrinis lubricantis TaxID=2086470 RepID=A0ABW1IRY6_9BACL
MDLDKLNAISSFTSKLLRKSFGRGPTSCQPITNREYLTLYIRGFISPMEEVLMKEGSSPYVEKARTLIIEHIVKEIEGMIKFSFDCEVIEYYQDWNFPNNSGFILFVLDQPLSEESSVLEWEIPRLEAEIARISQIVQKVPDHIHTYVLSSQMCLVERSGILIMIEKELISKGYSFELKRTKDELEKSYFHRHGEFEQIFHRKVKEILIDWNFNNDKSIMAFVLD